MPHEIFIWYCLIGLLLASLTMSRVRDSKLLVGIFTFFTWPLFVIVYLCVVVTAKRVDPDFWN